MSDRFSKFVISSFVQDRTLANQPLEGGPPPPLHLVQGFIRAAAGTTLGPADRNAIARRWAIRVAGKEKSSTTATCRELNALEWSWPSFDAMVARLRQDDLWPMPWHRYKEKILAGADLHDVRSKILIASARTASTSAKLWADSQFTTMLRLEGWRIYTDSEVGAHYAARFISMVDPKDWMTWPPLYPGDLSRLERGGDGVHSRFGRFYGIGVKRPSWADPFK